DVRLPAKGSAGLIAYVANVPWSFQQTTGYRLMLDASGAWQLLIGDHQQIAHGTAAKPGDAWHRLKLSCCAGLTTASLDGKKLAAVQDISGGLEGMAGLATGWNRAWFKHFYIKALAGPSLINEDLAFGCNVTASSQWSKAFGASNVVDGRLSSRWNAANGDIHNAWVVLTLHHRQQVSGAGIVQWGGRINNFRFQYFSGTKWRDLHTGSIAHTRGALFHFKPVTARKFRLLIESTVGNAPPSVRKIYLFR
ncbi:MAG: discoidin domain-containing protein, partial [Phycisphaerae bacterium]